MVLLDSFQFLNFSSLFVRDLQRHRLQLVMVPYEPVLQLRTGLESFSHSMKYVRAIQNVIPFFLGYFSTCDFLCEQNALRGQKSNNAYSVGILSRMPQKQIPVDLSRQRKYQSSNI